MTQTNRILRLSITITRPANATPYTAGDVVANTTPAAIPFGVAVTNRGAEITRAFIVTSNPAHVAALRLHLYAISPSTAATADNAVLPLSNSDASNYLGYIDFLTFITSPTSTMAFCEGTLIARPMTVFGTTGNIFGMLQASVDFVPITSQVIRVNLFTSSFS